VNWVCKIVELIIVIAPVVAVIVAVMALSQTKYIAARQIIIIEQEWPECLYEKF